MGEQEAGSENKSCGREGSVLRAVPTDLGAAGLSKRLSEMSRRGKLAGYKPGDGCGSFAAHGTPFEGRVEVSHDGSGALFRLVMPNKGPIAFAVILVLSVWPGLPITEGFLQNFLWYERLTSGSFATWMWYLPLTVLPAPFAWRTAVRKSKATAARHAVEVIDRIESQLTD